MAGSIGVNAAGMDNTLCAGRYMHYALHHVTYLSNAVI